MKKAALFVVFLFPLAGCTQEQGMIQKSETAVPVQEVEEVEMTQPTLPTEAVETVEEVVEEETGVEMVAPEAMVQEMEEEIKEEMPVIEEEKPVMPTEGAEDITGAM